MEPRLYAVIAEVDGKATDYRIIECNENSIEKDLKRISDLFLTTRRTLKIFLLEPLSASYTIRCNLTLEGQSMTPIEDWK